MNNDRHLYCIKKMFIAILLGTACIFSATAEVRSNGSKTEQFTKHFSDQLYLTKANFHQPHISERVEKYKQGPQLPYGIAIDQVFKDTTAEKIGITPGSVLFAINGKTIYERFGYNHIKSRSKGGFNLEWVDAKGQRKAAKVKAPEGRIYSGLFGVYMRDHRNLLGWYAHSKFQNDQWDKHVMLATHLLDQHHFELDDDTIRLIETALANAVESGMPKSHFLNSLAADLAWVQGKYAEAWPLVKAMSISDNVKNEYLIIPLRRMRIARAVHQNQHVAKLIDVYGIQASEFPYSPYIKRWVDEVKKLPKDLEGESPAKIADQPTRVIRTLKNKDMSPETNYFRGESIFQNKILAREPVSVAGHPDTYHVASITLDDLMENFDVIAKLRIKSIDSPNNKFPNLLTFAVYDHNYLKSNNQIWATINQQAVIKLEFPDKSDPITTVGARPFPTDHFIKYPKIDRTGLVTQTLRLTRIGNRVQIQVNGKTLLDSYILSGSSRMMVVLHGVGLHLSDVTLDVYKLDLIEK